LKIWIGSWLKFILIYFSKRVFVMDLIRKFAARKNRESYLRFSCDESCI
jgi:hypothetical protein